MASSSPPSKRRRTNQGKDEAGDTSSPPSSTLKQLSPVVVFADGAGAPSSSEWMISQLYASLQGRYLCFSNSLLGISTKDALCPLEKLESTHKKMKSLSCLHVINGGDHSFKVAKKHLQTNGSTQDEAEDFALQAIAAFL